MMEGILSVRALLGWCKTSSKVRSHLVAALSLSLWTACGLVVEDNPVCNDADIGCDSQCY